MISSMTNAERAKKFLQDIFDGGGSSGDDELDQDTIDDLEAQFDTVVREACERERAARQCILKSGHNSCNPIAALFRVRLEFLETSELTNRPAVNGAYHATLFVAATDAEAAATAARKTVAERKGSVPDCVRVLSVKFIEPIDILI